MIKTMNHPRRTSRDPLKGAALAVRQSRPRGALGASPVGRRGCFCAHAVRIETHRRSAWTA
ncbi:MAG: hypothetical protein CVU21_14555 [Betaproteobacteria bacterium HGW-Betaproteobacteria-15]|nr:MAG: hypothetical protein CVU21_14555 [Betaproteobacteria bacterium HGW-Betaproteobacteria-15]